VHRNRIIGFCQGSVFWNHALHAPAAEQNCSRYVFALSYGMIKTAFLKKEISLVVPKVSKKLLNKTVCVVGPGYVGLPYTFWLFW